MQNHPIDDVTAKLREVLSLERSLLMDGQLREAAGLADEKLEALGRLETTLVSAGIAGILREYAPAIEKVQAMAIENAVHFEAIRNALRSLAARLDEVNGAHPVGAYGRSGAKLPFTGAIGRYNKRV